MCMWGEINMFQVRDKHSKKVYTVFTVKGSPQSVVDEARFLIYKEDKWEWVWARWYEPYK